MASEKTPRRLGRGLDALFNATAAADAVVDSPLKDIQVARIRPNPFQPRKNFNSAELKELQESLKASGLLQPITVRPKPGVSEEYELIAGERRFRAASELGWKTISAIVRELTDRELLGLALIENLQRADLNPIEEAEGYGRLISDFGHTQQTVASMVGRDRSTIANMLRILQLPISVQALVRNGALSAGHVRPLLALSDQTEITKLAQEIADKGLSAREVERRVRDAVASAPKTPKRGRPSRIDSRSSNIRALEEQLRRHLQTDVSITVVSDHRGSIRIAFYSTDDLERIIEIVGLTLNPQ